MELRLETPVLRELIVMPKTLEDQTLINEVLKNSR